MWDIRPMDRKWKKE